MNLREELARALGPGYVLESELEGGGMSRLFVASDQRLGRRVVVKVVAAEVSQLRSVERFRREVLLAVSLQHPHIVSVLDAGDVGGVPYFIMPYVEGQSLRERLDGGPLSPRDAVAILRDVARACAYAHGRGVVHRDIKPGNILLAGGSAMIADFGVAKALTTLEQPAPAPLTHEGMTIGTPGYMAPEQIAGDPAADARVDIYALGMVAYEMLSGQAAFAGRTPQAVLAAARPDIPPGLAALVMRCLEKDPASRPQTAAEIAASLEDPAIVSGAHATRPLPAVRASPRRWLVPAGVVLGALAALGAVAWFGLRTPAARPVAERSVAILPLANASSDSGAAYLVNGITEDITAAVATLPGVTVMSAGSAASWAGRDHTPSAVRQALRVAMFVDGALETSGARLRLFARLIATDDGRTVWSRRFEGPRDSIFALQDSLAAELMRALSAAGESAAPHAAGRRGPAGTADVEAYDLFLRGRYDFQRRTGPALLKAIAELDSAVERDRGFARAYAALASVYTVLPLYTRTNADSATAKALVFIAKALALDSGLAEALVSRGALYISMWRWGDAERDLRRAIVADSANADAWQALGEWCMLGGRLGEADAALSRAERLTPTAAVPAAELALVRGLEGRTADALALVARAEALAPGMYLPPLVHGAVLVYAGRPAEAIAPFQQARRLSGDVPAASGWLGYALAAAGQRPYAEALRDTLMRRANEPGMTSALAHVALGLGDDAEALAMLEWAAGAHDPAFASEPLAAPMFDRLRGTPRFAEVVRRVGLDPRLARVGK